MPVTSIGGGGGEIVHAYLCPVCRPALVATGAVGLPAAWLAVIRSRGFEPRGGSVVSLSGVVPWAALGRDVEPNAVPWAHVDIAALDRTLVNTTVVRRIESDQIANAVIGWVS